MDIAKEMDKISGEIGDINLQIGSLKPFTEREDKICNLSLKRGDARIRYLFLDALDKLIKDKLINL